MADDATTPTSEEWAKRFVRDVIFEYSVTQSDHPRWGANEGENTKAAWDALINDLHEFANTWRKTRPAHLPDLDIRLIEGEATLRFDGLPDAPVLHVRLLLPPASPRGIFVHYQRRDPSQTGGSTSNADSFRVFGYSGKQILYRTRNREQFHSAREVAETLIREFLAAL